MIPVSRFFLSSSLVLLLTAAVLLWVWWDRAAPPAELCREDMWVVADDGERLPVSLYRCEARREPGPALVLWPENSRRVSARFLHSLDDWTQEGRAIWLVRSPVRDEFVADLHAIRQAVVESPVTDEETLAMILSGDSASQVISRGTAALPGELSALVLITSAAEPDLEDADSLDCPVALIVAKTPSRAARDAAAWLARAIPLS